MRRAHLVAAAALAAVALTGGPATGGGGRQYSISVEVVYGANPSRRSHLEKIERALDTWIARSGPLRAPDDKGIAELHLRVVMNRIELRRGFAGTTSGEQEILFESSSRASQAPPYSALFEVEVLLLDPHTDEVLVRKEMIAFNEQRYSELTRDPKQRAWDVSVEFLIDRIDNLLRKRSKKIKAHLREREAASGS